MSGERLQDHWSSGSKLGVITVDCWVSECLGFLRWVTERENSIIKFLLFGTESRI